ncbi:MAG: TrkA family potassium uptake protein [Clostridia bacterium]|nr:TrkA family potassium uptake protein [Clostridia bacterium]
MKSVLLIGLGRFGTNVADKLYELKHEVMALDMCEERINEILPIVTRAQIGDSTDVELLRSLGVEDYDVCIVTIKDFADSLQTVSLLKELGAKAVVARAVSDTHEKFLLRNGADETVYPEKQLATWTAVCFTSNHVFDYIRLDDNHSIFEVTIPDEWNGKTVEQLAVRRKHGLNIMAVKREDGLDMAITPDMVLTTDMHILVLGGIKNIKKVFNI